MKIERRNNHKKKIIIGGMVGLSVLTLGILATSYSKYRVTDSVKLGEGIVNYSGTDFELIGMYLINEDNIETKIDVVPGDGYVLNEEKTKCTVKDTEVAASIEYKDNKLYFGDITNKGTKCKVYFNEILDSEAPVIGVHEARNVEKNSMDLYVEAIDNIGITGYYFKANTASDWGEAKCVGATSCTYSASGLIANTSYTYDVKVCDGAGNCPTTSITQKTKANGIETGEIIAGGQTTTDSMFSGTSGDGVYTWTKGDYSGGSQVIKYFRGNVNNNWVVFGKDGDNYIWWRIIRNNSNGSIRMIYAGTSSSKTSAPATTGSGTQIGKKSLMKNIIIINM